MIGWCCTEKPACLHGLLWRFGGFFFWYVLFINWKHVCQCGCWICKSAFSIPFPNHLPKNHWPQPHPSMISVISNFPQRFTLKSLMCCCLFQTLQIKCTLLCAHGCGLAVYLYFSFLPDFLCHISMYGFMINTLSGQMTLNGLTLRCRSGSKLPQRLCFCNIFVS